ncbi:MAG: hypothetical protein ACREML_05905, partial [Vulcanimicrobiaceae bacterium]
MVIIGPGASSLSISGVSNTQGGAIVSDGNLAIFSSTLSNNSASIGGGAIFAESGNLVITGATFTSNSMTASTSSPPAEGGAIQSWVQATIDASTFTGNTVTQNATNGSAYGGAAAEDRTTAAGLTIMNSQFYSNSTCSPQGYASAGAIED